MSRTAPFGGSIAKRSVRWTLRDSVHAKHEAVHGMPVFADLLGGALDRGRYAALLGCFHAYHHSSEPVTREADRLLDYERPGAEGRERMTRLESDLAMFGEATPHAAPLCPDPRAGWNIGFAYVVRGSSLGGKVIHKALDGLFEREQTGRAFFLGAPSDPARWRDFCARAERRRHESGFVEAAVSGADAAFTHFRSCMEGR